MGKSGALAIAAFFALAATSTATAQYMPPQGQFDWQRMERENQRRWQQSQQEALRYEHAKRRLEQEMFQPITPPYPYSPQRRW